MNRRNWNICRICLKTDDDMQEIYTTLPEPKVHGPTLADQIELCGDIQLDPSADLPRLICSSCLLLVQVAYKFRQLCQESKTKLPSLLDATIEPEAIGEAVDNQKDEGELQIMYECCVFLPQEESEEDNRSMDLISVIESDEMQEHLAGNEADYEEWRFYEPVAENGSADAGKIVFEEFMQAGENAEEEIAEHAPLREGQGKSSGQTPTQTRHEAEQLRVTKKKKASQENEGKIYQCSDCGNVYSIKAKLTAHIKFKHAKLRPHECEICHKRFAQTPQLARHMNTHTGHRPYKCDNCQSCFADPSTLIKHRRIHTQERPFKCALCPKTFTYSNVLKTHMNIHTGEKPFKCDICLKSFTQQHHMISHRQFHKPLDGNSCEATRGAEAPVAVLEKK